MADEILTRASQVLVQIAKGARIQPDPWNPRLLRLLSADGVEIRAWQQALQAALRQGGDR